MDTAPRNDNATNQGREVSTAKRIERPDGTASADLFPEAFSSLVEIYQAAPPVVSGQCAEVLELIRKHQPILSFVMTADHAIPEAAARVHDLRAMGFNIITTRSDAEFRGIVRRSAASYSIGVPEWPRPGFLVEGRLL